MNVTPEIRNRIIGMFMFSMIPALTFVALSAGGETTQVENAEMAVLDTTEVDSTWWTKHRFSATAKDHR